MIEALVIWLLCAAFLVGVGYVVVDTWRRGERWAAITLSTAMWVILLIAIAVKMGS